MDVGGHRGEANTLPTGLEAQWMSAVNQTIASSSKYMNLLSVQCCNTAATLELHWLRFGGARVKRRCFRGFGGDKRSGRRLIRNPIEYGVPYSESTSTDCSRHRENRREEEYLMNLLESKD